MVLEALRGQHGDADWREAPIVKLGDLRRFYLTDRVRRTPVASLADLLWPRWESTFAIRLRAFAPELRDDLRERARVAFERRLADIAVADKRLAPEEIVQICYLQEQVKVEKFSGHMWNQRLPTRFPFSYPRYVDLLLRVRPDDRMRQTFQIHVLHGARYRPAAPATEPQPSAVLARTFRFERELNRLGRFRYSLLAE